MRINEILRLVLINIRQNKFKVFLTSLGIIVGAATIVMVIAIGEGGIQDVEEQFSTLNAGTITVQDSTGVTDFMAEMEGMMGGMAGGREAMSGGPTSGGMSSGPPSGSPSSGGRSGGDSNKAAAMAAASAQKLSEENLEDLLYFVPDLTTGAIYATVETSVLGGELEEAVEYTIVGTQSSYQNISNLTLLMGEFITEVDEIEEMKCVVLGYEVATEIFSSITDAYDSKVEIDGRTYIVSGILSQMGTVVSGVNPDTCVFMPYTTADKYLLEAGTSPTITLLASDIDSVTTVMDNVELVLTQSNPDATYSITDAGATMEAAMQSANTLSLLLLAVAVIVFIVGGIGIMNVLFVSVKERTREIGILKAIGTKKTNILLLFLAEANIIGVFGGVFGILLSFVLVPLLEYMDISAIMTPSSLILAFLFAMVTGTLFGVYPAYSAARLVPIEALNNE